MTELCYWRRAWFKQGKVWVVTDGQGQPLEHEGRVRFAYKKGDSRSYTTGLDRLRPVEGSVAEQGPAAAEPLSSERKPTASGRAASRGSGSAGHGKGRVNDELFGGDRSDLEDPRAIHLWSDGACSGNPGPAGAGTVLLAGDLRKEFSTWLGEGTNNTAELAAVLQGLQALRRPVRRTLIIHTDSQYVIGVLARGWKAKANGALVTELRDQLDGLEKVIWHWVRGHEGVELNERCDELARQAIERRDSTVEVLP